MRRLKPIYISILTVVVFVGALLIGMQTDWWMTDGRKTPLDGVTAGDHEDEETEHEESDLPMEVSEIEDYDDEEEHDHDEDENGYISGGSTIQDVLNIGLTDAQAQAILDGSIDKEDPTKSLKTLTEERGLKFGEVKDALNKLLSE